MSTISDKIPIVVKRMPPKSLDDLSKTGTCRRIGCRNKAYYNMADKAMPFYCGIHRNPDMINVTEKRRCRFEGGCSKRASFNMVDQTTPFYCGIHRKPGMINITEKRLCRFGGGCGKRASFNFPEFSIGKYCSEHKKPDMLDVVNPKCKFEGCNKICSFNLETETIPMFCKKHKTPEMVDVHNSKCFFTGCKKIPQFNLIGKKSGLYCVTHKLEGMICVTAKKCQFDGCESLQPRFNVFGSTVGIFCSVHKKPDMIDVVHEKCLHPGCLTRPSYNIPGTKIGIYCSDHKSLEMINVNCTKCEYENCLSSASFNYDGLKPSYCSIHKSPEMIKIYEKKCQHSGCKKSATQNWEGCNKNEGIYCAEHKEKGMIDVKHKCIEDKCLFAASFGPLFKPKIHCGTHKRHNELSNNRPKCDYEDCKLNPFYTDVGNFPKRCETHKLVGDKNIIEMPCSSCNLIDHINEETKLCNSCAQYPKIHKIKENFIGAALRTNGFKIESEDKIIMGGCSKYRPDFIIDYLLFKVIVEVDENQHNSYSPECEISRMKQIFQDFGGTPIIFVRYNPDTYTDNLGNSHAASAQRSNKLITLLKELKNYQEWNVPLSVYYMFYDGYNGINKSLQIDPMAI